MFRGAIIGIGDQARSVHLPVLANIDKISIEAICDINPQAMEKVIQTYKVGKTYTDYQRMLDEVEPDVAYVVTMPKVIAEIALNCIERGIHTFIEKPPGISTSETKQMADAASEIGVKTMVGLNRRFMPAIRKVLDLVGSRQILHVRTTQCGWAGVDENLEFWSRIEDIRGVGYMLLDNIHFIDFVRWLGGDVSHVDAVFNNFGRPHEVNWSGHFCFTDGSSGQFYSTTLGGEDDRGAKETYEIHWEGASAYIESKGGGLFAEVIFTTPSRQTLLVSSPRYRGSVVQEHGFVAQHEHFIDCIENDRTPETSIADAVKTMELIDRLKDSADSKR